MNRNTDLTRGRILAGPAYGNPQLSSASRGGYYGYFHSTNGQSDSMHIPVRYRTVDQEDGIRRGVMALHENYKARDMFPFVFPRDKVCPSELSVLYDSVSDSAAVLPLVVGGNVVKEYTRVPGSDDKNRMYELLQTWKSTQMYDRSLERPGARPSFRSEKCCSSNNSASWVFARGCTVSSFDRCFAMHGAFFDELESGNLEEPDGRMAYDPASLRVELGVGRMPIADLFSSSSFDTALRWYGDDGESSVWDLPVVVSSVGWAGLLDKASRTIDPVEFEAVHAMEMEYLRMAEDPEMQEMYLAEVQHAVDHADFVLSRVAAELAAMP